MIHEHVGVILCNKKKRFGHFLLVLDSLGIACSGHTQSAYKKNAEQF